MFFETLVILRPVYNGHPQEMEGDHHVRKYKATENIGKLSGDRNTQGDRCSIYRAVKYRFDCMYPYIPQTHK